MARGSVSSWVWLLLAAAVAVLAIAWWSLKGTAQPEPPRVDATGRRPFPQGGDFAGVRRDRPIEARELPPPSTLSGGTEATAAGGQRGAQQQQQ